MSKQFVSQPIRPTEVTGTDLPHAFQWGDELLEIGAVLKTWRGAKTDRGDVYLKRHWYECELRDGRIVTVYFDRDARLGARRWYLYTLEEPG